MYLHSFIVGTPLHLMIALSLIQQLRLENPVKIKFLNTFSGAEGLYDRIKNHDWLLSHIDFSLFPSKRQALADCIRDRTDILYSDSDASLQNYLSQVSLKALLPKVQLCVFEDGMGSYRDDIYRGFKKSVFDMIGVGTFLGGSPFTQTVFVFERERYLSIFPHVRAEVVEIVEPLSDTIHLLQHDLQYLFDYHPIDQTYSNECSIYLSSWSIDYGFLNDLKGTERDLFIKLHPHIREDLVDPDVIFLPRQVPAELILTDLASKYRAVTVYHHRSSVEQYIKLDNVQFFRV